MFQGHFVFVYFMVKHINWSKMVRDTHEGNIGSTKGVVGTLYRKTVTLKQTAICKHYYSHFRTS